MRLSAAAVHELRLFFVALQLLTRLPVPQWVGYRDRWLNECVRHFPAVGLVVGGVAALVVLGAARWWPPTVVAILTVSATAWLTGAFHEDGLADTFDALGGNVSRERALLIMKDSRIGSYGAAALVLVLGIRVALVSALVQRGAVPAALGVAGAHVLGRGCAGGLMSLLPYAGDAGQAKAKPLATAVPPGSAAAAVGASALIAAVLAAFDDSASVFSWGLAMASATAVTLAMRRWLMQRLGGYTGDTLGATEQLAEVAVLLALAAA